MKWLEILFWSVGITLVLVFFGTQAWGEFERQRGVAAFVELQQSDNRHEPMRVGLMPALLITEDPTTAIELQQPPGEEVLALLRIAEIGLELPVRYGTDEKVLRRGPGLVEGTSLPGSNGNVAIAAHRDLHFRGLKDLELGDLIELETPNRTQTYVVTGLSVVNPTDVQVLDEIGQSVLTLVTCYPFYFVGNAPKRFIVRAESAEFLR